MDKVVNIVVTDMLVLVTDMSAQAVVADMSTQVVVSDMSAFGKAVVIDKPQIVLTQVKHMEVIGKKISF